MLSVFVGVRAVGFDNRSHIAFPLQNLCLICLQEQRCNNPQLLDFLAHAMCRVEPLFLQGGPFG